MIEAEVVSSTLVGTNHSPELELAFPFIPGAISEDLDSVGKVLEKLEGLHRHLCPRQVLGVRTGLYAADLLSLDVPREDKRLMAFMETDGCFLDGVIAATGCAAGRRTMRILDVGKVAGTFVDVDHGDAFRIVPRSGIRIAAREYAPGARNKWTAQLEGYKVMPSHVLLEAVPVQLTVDLERIISRAGLRVDCDQCGEEIINEREVVRDGVVLCRHCDGESYYQRAPHVAIRSVA